MLGPEGFEVVGARAFFRPAGVVTLEEGIGLVERAIQRARVEGVSELLLDLTRVTGFLAPSLSERFALAERWSKASAMSLRIAMVAPVALLDPERFGVVVMANRGLTTTAVETEAEAIAWLDSLRDEPG